VKGKGLGKGPSSFSISGSIAGLGGKKILLNVFAFCSAVLHISSGVLALPGGLSVGIRDRPGLASGFLA